MTTAADVLSKVASQIGTKEVPNNRTKYGRWYGMDGEPWCDIGVSWAFDQCGMGAVEGKFAYCPYHVSSFKRRGRWHTSNPQPGDVVFFDWGRDGVADHVGFVVRDLGDGRIETIECNTQSGAAGNQSDGGGVYRRYRSKSTVMGYGRPAYNSAPVPVRATLPPRNTWKNAPALEIGDMGPGEWGICGSFGVTMQTDGNLVIYGPGGAAVWSTATRDTAKGGRFYAQDDGNLVIKNASGVPVWASGTRDTGKGGRLVMQADGNLVLYGKDGRPVWAAGVG